MKQRRAAGAVLAAAVAASLVAGIFGGLLRAGVTVPGIVGTDWLARAALAHAALMICGFLGTMVAVERAVAAKQRGAWLAPLASGVAAVALLCGAPAAAAWLWVAAAAVFTVVNLALWRRRQRAAHTALLLGSALAWLAGTVLYSAAVQAHAVLPWWFAFLVMTIAAERLEMSRLLRRRRAAQGALLAVLALLVAGAAVSLAAPAAGGVLFGIALLLLAAWLFFFDIARRTVRADGLARYMAVCLLAGYAWLGVGGAAWAATALGWPARDIALHALGLGFIVSMIMGHAPVILPAVARVKVQFGSFFYVPLVALHASLLLRLVAGHGDLRWRAKGALLNALAIALFAGTVIGAALAWRRRHGSRRTTREHP